MRDTSVLEEYVCQIHAIRHVEVRALERGYLQHSFVDEGQFVRQGQRMFQIMPALYEAEFQKAQAEAQFAEIEYQNTQNLADGKVVSPNELALSKARFEKAKAELNLAAIHLGFTEVRAPFDGIVDKFEAFQGSLIDEGDLLTQVSDNSQLWVYFNVPEAQYLGYQSQDYAKNGKLVRLRMANGSIFDHPGTITAIEANFDNTTGNIAFRATFENPKWMLRHGETGTILMERRLQNALIIPQKATFEILDQRYVYVVDANGILHSRLVHVAEEIPHAFVLTDGLKPGERFLLEGIRKVREGQQIRMDFIPALEVMRGLDLYAE